MPSALKTLWRNLRQPFNALWARRRLAEYKSRPRTLEETVEWAMHFGGGGHMTVRTLQIPSEITRLARMVAELEPKVILEIGTARGGTLLIWSSLASERVVSCDLLPLHRQAPLFTKFAPEGSKCRTTLLDGDSHDPSFKARVARELGGAKVDFLFIDGDHTESGVERDYRDYVEFVRPGGLVAFHDIVEKQPLPTNQVYGFWKRLRQEADVVEFIDNPKQCGFGIGVVRIPS
jgi:predicted O-methyltransferase YrrM